MINQECRYIVVAEAIDPCLSNPCQNGGICKTETPSLPGVPLLYICMCQMGHFGQHCEHIGMYSSILQVVRINIMFL